MKEKRAASIVAGSIVLVGAALLGVSLFAAVVALPGSASSLSVPGSVLYSAYGFSSLLVPCYLLWAALLLIIPGWSVRAGVMLAGSFVPFLTAAAGEKLIHTVALPIGSESMSRIVAAGLVISAILAIVVEYVLLLLVADRFAFRASSAPVSVTFDEPEIPASPVADAIFDESAAVAEDAELAQTATQDIAQELAAHEYSSDVIAEPDIRESGADSKVVSDVNFAETFAERQSDDSGDFEAAPQAAAAVAPTGVETPTYVDFEKMRAPFDLPVIDEWVPSEEGSAVLDEMPEADVPLENQLEEPVEDFSEPLEDSAQPASNLEDDFAEPAIESSAVSAFDPPMMEDFDEEEEAGEADDTDEIGFDAEEIDLEDSAETAVEGMSTQRSGLLAAASTLPPVVSVPPASKAGSGDGAVDSESVTAVSTTSSFPLKLFAKKKRLAYSVPYDILTSYPDGEYWIVDDTTRRAAAALKETLNEFRIEADVTGIRKGPVITMFEILPAPGVKLSKIVGLQDNIALRLAASSVRIVAPIPGKHAVGIEVPNLKRSIVSFRELIETDTPSAKKMEIPVVLGKDITGEAQLLDLASTPHLLIAGSTGSGKSVCVNSIILSILYKRSPEDVKLILIDPKIVELKLYNDIGHLLAPVITEPKKAFQSLQYCLCEMERRYALLDGMGVRDIKSYNKRIKERNIATEKIPYLVVIIDEFADLMATTGKELESTVARLCAMSRAVGIHLVLATQRPSIDVITGLIKANIPTRIAFMVASKMDSRIIIDQVGAEKLLGKGDMLYASATDPFPVRIQGAFVSEEEVERVVEHVKTLGEPEYIDEEIFVEDDEDAAIDQSLFSDGEDPLYDKALEIVMLAGKASASYIQRKLKIGYNRAARLVEDMEARGIVGPANGSKPREVIHHI
jgi:S-DNA-T family DNA segregation ATPase FtsK/SpoIIIE